MFKKAQYRCILLDLRVLFVLEKGLIMIFIKFYLSFCALAGDD